MMGRSVVEHHYGRTVIALLGDLFEELDDGAAFDRRTRDVVSQRVGSEAEGLIYNALLKIKITRVVFNPFP
jgi:hypothetical protein